jgi:hypothetical protein
VFVIDSRKDARAASAGGILVSRLMKRGVAGVVTDGGFRDSPEIAKLAIPAYHQRPSAPTNLTLHQAIDIDVPIGCGDAPVFPGDIVVGDAEGCGRDPGAIADAIADEAVAMTVFEDFVQERVLEGRSHPRPLSAHRAAPPAATREDFAAWRAGARPVHERPPVAPQGPRPWPGAGARTRRDRALPALQQRPPRGRQRARLRADAAAPAVGLAGAAADADADRPQHGWAGDPQRLPRRGAAEARLAAAAEAASSSSARRTTVRRWSAVAT